MASPWKIPNKSRAMEIWQPLIGRRAAIANFRAMWVIGAAPYVAISYFVLIYAAIHLVHSWASTVAWVAGTLTVAFGFSGIFFVWQWHKEAGKALGVKVTSKNPPPSDHINYVDWCRRNGVRPLNGSAHAER
jgi:hypothetical protein